MLEDRRLGAPGPEAPLPPACLARRGSTRFGHPVTAGPGASGERRRRAPTPESGPAFALGDDRVVTAGRDSVRVFARATGALRRCLRLGGAVVRCARVPGPGERLALVLERRRREVMEAVGVVAVVGYHAALLDLEAGTLRELGPALGAEPRVLAASPRGDLLALGFPSGSVRLQPLGPGAHERAVPLWLPFDALGFSPDGRWLACAASGDPDPTAELSSRNPEVLRVVAVDLGDRGASRRDPRTWLAGVRVTERVLPSTGRVDEVLVSPDGEWLAAFGEGTRRATLRLPELDPGKAPGARWGSWRRQAPRPATLSQLRAEVGLPEPEGVDLPVGDRHEVEARSADGALRARATPPLSGQAATLSLEGAGGPPVPALTLSTTARVDALAFTPDGRTLVAAARDWRLYLVDLREGRELGSVAGALGPVVRLRVDDEGRRLEATEALGPTLVWDLDELLRRAGG